MLSSTIAAATTYSFSALVVGVSDGDTITVLDHERSQHKIRLSGIDAPEKKQAFGQRSKTFLSDLIYGRTVVLECSNRDRYQREICVILLDGRDANLEQIKAGMAWWYRQYANTQTIERRATYERSESEARRNRVGLWHDNSAEPPWEWRRNGQR